MATGGVIPLAALVALLAGCAAPTAGSPSPAASTTSPPVLTVEAEAIDPVTQYARDRLRAMTLDQKIRSMFIVHLGGVDPAAHAAFAKSAGVGGLILMGDNVPEPSDGLATITTALSAEPGLPLLLGIDQEGGVVSRIDSDSALAAADLRFMDPSASRDAFAARSSMLEGLGVSVNFGIVADVTGDPDSFIYERSLGSTAGEASARVAQAVAGESGHVLSTLKHFPGHGVSPGDSHSSIPASGMSLQQWRAEHASPFAAGISAGAELVMFGHLQFDAIDPQPATLSAFWHHLVRHELGFDGIIVTDDMTMLQNSGRADLADPAANTVRAIAAGNTMVLFVGPVDVDGVVAAVHAAVVAGVIDERLIDDAAVRILHARRTLSGSTVGFAHCFEQCQAIIR